MKKIVFIVLALFAFVAYADNTITSKEYVDGQVATLQTQIPAKNTNTVLTNTGTAGSVGEKAIYDTTAAFGAQTDALVTAGQFNTAVQNALESEFVCVESNSQGCLLYEVRGATQKQTLPTGYTQLEYLESTGTQYIDTGVVLTSDNVTYEWNAKDYGGTNGCSLFGAQTNSNYSGILYNAGYYNQSGFPRTAYIGDISYSSLNYYADPNNFYNWGLMIRDDKTAVLYKNGSLAGSLLWSGTIQTGYSIFLYANDVFGYVRERGKVAFKYFAITDNGSLVFNGIPARRDSDGELGMYDTVSNTFFTNSGTGEFIAGPVFSYLPQGN